MISYLVNLWGIQCNVLKRRQIYLEKLLSKVVLVEFPELSETKVAEVRKVYSSFTEIFIVIDGVMSRAVILSDTWALASLLANVLDIQNSRLPTWNLNLKFKLKFKPANLRKFQQLVSADCRLLITWDISRIPFPILLETENTPCLQ